MMLAEPGVVVPSVKGHVFDKPIGRDEISGSFFIGKFYLSQDETAPFAVKKIQDILSKYNPFIDAVVNTGDAVLYYGKATEKYPNDAQWWRRTGLAEKSLFVLGNHDGAFGSNDKGHQEASADWDYMGKAWDFDTFFADYIDDLGITMPKGYDDPASPFYKSCFWLKDFEAAKIRIVGSFSRTRVRS